MPRKGDCDPLHCGDAISGAHLIDQAQKYFALLYPPELTSKVPPAYLSVVNQEPCVKSGAMPAKHILVTDTTGLAAEVVRLSQDVGLNVWNGICAHAEDLGAWHRGKRSEATLLPALWVDIDIAGPGHAATNLPQDVDQAVRGLLLPFGLEPTLIVHTGGGIHVYWCLDELQQVTDANRSELQALLKAWNAKFITLAESHGWHLDDTSDLARVLRPAGTLNRKPGRESLPLVSILLDSGPRYSLVALKAHIGASLIDQLLTSRPSAPAATEYAVLTYEATKAEVEGKIRRNAKPERKDVLRLITEGKSFAKPGDRDRALYQVCSWLSFYCPDGDPEAIADILQPSLDAMRLEAPDQDDYITREDALTKIERCLGDGRNRAAANKAADEKIRAALTRPKDSNRTASPVEGVVPRGVLTCRIAGIVPPSEPAPSVAGGTVGRYTKSPPRSDSNTVVTSSQGAERDSADLPRTDEDPGSVEVNGGGNLSGLASEVLAELKRAGKPLSLDGVCGRLDRARTKVKYALEYLVDEHLAYSIHPKGGKITWAAGQPPPEPLKEEEPEGDGLGDVNAFATRYTTREDLIAHGKEQLELSGIPPAIEGWEDDDPDSYLAGMALRQTIITSPVGDKFIALPRPDGVGRRYVMFAKTELETNFWRDFKTPKTIWERSYVNTKGDVTEKSFRQVLSELSVPVSKWVYNGMIDTSHIDDDGVFQHRCWILEPMEGAFDSDCDAYLRTWGEENYTRICDWFIHLKNRDMPATMLVLQGDSGDGKDLLIQAAAAQFRKQGGAVTGALATDVFNADMNECPVVGCSEMLPSDWKGTPMNSNKLREAITRRYHDFNEKNQRRVKLTGFLRWILSSNEANFFPTKEVLSQASQEAILRRLTVIEAPRLDTGVTAPSAFLTERGNFDLTRDWIDTDNPKMVRHMRHIMETRTIQFSDGRMGVAPHAGSFRERLAVNTQLSSLIIDGLVRFLLGEVSRKQLSKSVRVGSGKVLVQIGELHKQWATLTALGEGAGGSSNIDAHRRDPGAKVFAEEVSQRLATRDEVVIDGRVYKSVRTELLSTHASALGRDLELHAALLMSEEEFASRQKDVKGPAVFGKAA